MYSKVSPASFCMDMSSESGEFDDDDDDPSKDSPLFSCFSSCLSPLRSPHRTALKIVWWVMKQRAFESMSCNTTHTHIEDKTFELVLICLLLKSLSLYSFTPTTLFFSVFLLQSRKRYREAHVSKNLSGKRCGVKDKSGGFSIEQAFP